VERRRLGLIRLEEALDDLGEHFGLRAEDLNIDPAPLGDLLPPPDPGAVAFGRELWLSGSPTRSAR
jgi:hypothetical protein